MGFGRGRADPLAQFIRLDNDTMVHERLTGRETDGGNERNERMAERKRDGGEKNKTSQREKTTKKMKHGNKI